MTTIMQDEVVKTDLLTYINQRHSTCNHMQYLTDLLGTVWRLYMNVICVHDTIELQKEHKLHIEQSLILLLSFCLHKQKSVWLIQSYPHVTCWCAGSRNRTTLTLLFKVKYPNSHQTDQSEHLAISQDFMWTVS